MNRFAQERNAYIKYHRTIERELKPYFSKALSMSIEPLMNWVNDYGLSGLTKGNIEMLIREDVWRTVYGTVFELIGQRSASKEYYWQRTVDGGIKARTVDFLRDVWSKTLRDYAMRYTSQIEGELNNHTVDLIYQALGESENLEIDSQGRIRWFFSKVKDMMRTRTETISRTEATRISNLGKDIGARSWIDENGGGGYKMWLGRVINERDTHLETNNIIIPIDEKYEVGGEECLRPGDRNLSAKEVVNCRCTQSFMSQRAYDQLVRRGRIVNGKVVE